jgi:hypothetical protein
MGRSTENRCSELRGKLRGSDNVWNVNFAICKVSDFSKVFGRRVLRVLRSRVRTIRPLQVGVQPVLSLYGSHGAGQPVSSPAQQSDRPAHRLCVSLPFVGAR